MPLDLEYLRRHYAGLSDAGLRAIDRNGLVAAAQACYDEELARRAPSRTTISASAAPPDRPDQDEEEETGGESAAPAWLEQAACVATFVPYPGAQAESHAETAREVLRAAGIPCSLTLEKAEPESPDPRPQSEYRVMVPGAQSLHALSVLDREIFNERVEDDWRTHFEALSDEELRALSLDDVCGGMLDRIERLKRVYDEETARRGG